MKHFSHVVRPYRDSLGSFFRIADISLLALSLYFGVLVFQVEWGANFILVTVVAVALYATYAEIAGLYQTWRIYRISQEAGRILLVWIFVVSTLLLLGYATKSSAHFSRRVILSWMVATPGVLVLFHLFMRSLLVELRRRGRNVRRAVIIGDELMCNKLAHAFETDTSYGIQVRGFYLAEGEERAKQPIDDPIPYLGGESELLRALREGEIAADVVFITFRMRDEEEVKRLIAEFADSTISVYVVPDIFVFDLLHSRWSVVNNLPIISVYETPFFGVDGWMKRLEDILLSSLILMLIAVPMLAIAIGVKLTSRGPVIFKQRRYGLNGEEIIVWKFRSMTTCDDGDKVQQARKGDARITPLGAFLRKTSLDELPQFINVLQGRMSIVGPRPHAVAHNEEYRKKIYGYMLRHKVRPGITGWAQVNGWRGETDTLQKMEKRIEFDLEYIRKWTLWLDIRIILLTVVKGFVGENAY